MNKKLTQAIKTIVVLLALFIISFSGFGQCSGTSDMGSYTNTTITICAGTSLTFGNTAGSSSGNNYDWYYSYVTGGGSSGGGWGGVNVSTTTVTPSVTTTYTLVETLYGCSTPLTTSYCIVIVKQSPPALSLGGPYNICSGNSMGIGAAAQSGVTYSWASSPAGFTSASSNPAISPTVTTASTTTYTLTETETSSGCSLSYPVVVTVNPLPVANTGSPSTICSGSPITLGAAATSGHTYSWASLPSGFSSTLSGPTVAPNTTTTYVLTETITATGCHKRDSVVVTVNPLPSNTVAPSQAICPGEIIDIGNDGVGAAPAPYCVYAWSSSPAGLSGTGIDAQVNPTVQTTYYLKDSNTLTHCHTKYTIILSIDTNTIVYGTAPGGTTDGWYITPHHCNYTLYDLIIWGNTATFGNYPA